MSSCGCNGNQSKRKQDEPYLPNLKIQEAVKNDKSFNSSLPDKQIPSKFVHPPNNGSSKVKRPNLFKRIKKALTNFFSSNTVLNRRSVDKDDLQRTSNPITRTILNQNEDHTTEIPSTHILTPPQNVKRHCNDVDLTSQSHRMDSSSIQPQEYNVITEAIVHNVASSVLAIPTLEEQDTALATHITDMKHVNKPEPSSSSPLMEEEITNSADVDLNLIIVKADHNCGDGKYMQLVPEEKIVSEEILIQDPPKKKRNRSNSETRKSKRRKTGSNANQKEIIASAPAPLLQLDNNSKNVWIRDIQVGNLKGIQWNANSCYLDATLFSLFYTNRIFENFLEQELSHCSPTNHFALASLEVLASDIIRPLRSPQSLVTSQAVMKLRRILARREGSQRFCVDMMDVDELVDVLFEQILQLRWFINYTNGGTSYLHPIIFDTSHSPGGTTDVQNLLEKSMSYYPLKFQDVPQPLLIIKMPRDNGELVGYKGILPNLELVLNSMLTDGACHSIKMYLLAIILIGGRHYTAFARNGVDTASDWYFFNSIGPEVRREPGLGNDLQRREHQLKQASNMIMDNSPSVSQIERDNHICIYISSPEED